MFETAGMLLTFVTLGKYLETSARTYTTAALKQLASMQPRKAVRVVCSPESGLPLLTAAAEESIEASALRLGDVVKVRDCFHCLLGACSCFFVPFCVCVCLYS
jgi:Cu+-exporting ATPase